MRAKLITLILVLFLSCHMERRDMYSSYVVNRSGSKSEFNYYKNGFMDVTQGLIIENHERKLVYEGGGDDLNNYPTYVSLMGFDSLIIIFENSKIATHYNYNRIGINSKAILFSDKRNIFNKDNWEQIMIEKKKNVDKRNFYYFITTEDLLNAK